MFGWLVLGFFIHLIGVGCAALRWQMLLRGMGIRQPFLASGAADTSRQFLDNGSAKLDRRRYHQDGHALVRPGAAGGSRSRRC